MESQPSSGGGGEGVSTDDIVYELAETIIATILTKIPDEEFNIHLFKVHSSIETATIVI